MSIRIDKEAASELATQFEEALELVRNEFEGLDPHRQYRNAFSRLLKPDPLGRVSMMGTDQRDLFVPELCRLIEEAVPRAGEIFDFGAGDGRTFALVADRIPPDTRISIEEPNPEYVARYRALLERKSHLRLGSVLAVDFDRIDAGAESLEAPLPADGTMDLCLALHMVYFLDDLAAGLARMVRFLKPGGVLFLVLTDESAGYTGLVLRRFIEQGGDTGDRLRHLSAIDERRLLLGPPNEGGGAIVAKLAATRTRVEIEARRQASRLYGHNLGDLIALSSITALAGVAGLDKFTVAAGLLRDQPEAADLRIEDEGPRRGMWSVAQPQWVVTLRRMRDE